MINDEKANFTQNEGSDDSWGYLTSYGPQSLNKDNLGLAVIFNPKYFREFTEDGKSKIIVFNPDNGEADYYFLAAWELEKNGITTEDEFMAYVQKTAKELAHPVEVQVKK